MQLSSMRNLVQSLSARGDVFFNVDPDGLDRLQAQLSTLRETMLQVPEVINSLAGSAAVALD